MHSVSPYTLSSIIHGLVSIGLFKRFGLDREHILWQPTLKSTASFGINRSDEVRLEVKILALALILSQDLRFTYTDNAPSKTATCAPIVHNFNSRSHADVWSVFLSVRVDERPLFPRHGFLQDPGQRLVGVLERQARVRQDVPGKRIIHFIKTFLDYTEKLLTQLGVSRALVTSWKEGNWLTLKEHLEKIEELKDKVFEMVRIYDSYKNKQDVFRAKLSDSERSSDAGGLDQNVFDAERVLSIQDALEKTARKILVVTLQDVRRREGTVSAVGPAWTGWYAMNRCIKI